MSKEVNKNVDRLRTFFRNEQPYNHPIENHPIADKEEYVKGLYFDMLCVMSMYENDDTENQNRFIQRIMAGSGDKTPISEHIKNAMQLTAEKMSEIIKQVKDNELSEIFYLDALIISCANGQPNKKQAEFLAELGDVLGFDKKKISFMCELSIAIIEQDFAKIRELKYKSDIEYSCYDENNCYIKYIIRNNVFNDKNNLHIFSLLYSGISIFAPKSALSSSHTMENLKNVTIENKLIDDYLTFKSINTITLVGCVITGCLEITGVQTVIIKNCCFRDFKGHLLSFKSPETQISIYNTVFENIKISNTAGAGVIDCSYQRNNRIVFEKCIFRNINTQSYYDELGIISRGNDCIVNECEFSNCTSSSSNHVLFYTGTLKESNNIYTGCNKVRR